MNTSTFRGFPEIVCFARFRETESQDMPSATETYENVMARSVLFCYD